MPHRIRHLVLALTFVLASCGETRSLPQAKLAVADALAGTGQQGFAKVTERRPFSFPADHGPHPAYATEWWYYTGNLRDAAGRRFGFQLTFFRFGLTPQAPRRASDFGASAIYMAHFALADGAGQFHAFERFSRDGAGLAGAQAEPFRAWLEGWSADSAPGSAIPMRLRAAQDDVAIDLTLQQGKPTVLQGDGGLSQKSAEPGNASYYYSITRMPTKGSVSVGGQRYEVEGLSWMDREWSTSALGPGQIGWDWFALQLDDGRELMYYRLRRADGGLDPYSKGVIVNADGTTQTLRQTDVTIEPTGSWTSQRSGAVYPSGWRLRAPSANIDLTIAPLLKDQELPTTVIYWEGAVDLGGSSGGSGYIELTGYADAGNALERARGR